MQEIVGADHLFYRSDEATATLLLSTGFEIHGNDFGKVIEYLKCQRRADHHIYRMDKSSAVTLLQKAFKESGDLLSPRLRNLPVGATSSTRAMEAASQDEEQRVAPKWTAAIQVDVIRTKTRDWRWRISTLVCTGVYEHSSTSSNFHTHPITITQSTRIRFVFLVSNAADYYMYDESAKSEVAFKDGYWNPQGVGRKQVEVWKKKDWRKDARRKHSFTVLVNTTISAVDRDGTRTTQALVTGDPAVIDINSAHRQLEDVTLAEAAAGRRRYGWMRGLLTSSRVEQAPLLRQILPGRGQ